MTSIRYQGRAFDLAPGETVLDGLLRHGCDVAHSCRAGACQSCLVRAVSGAPPVAAQVGLKETLKARGAFLACLARPEAELEIAPIAATDFSVRVRLARRERLAPGVVSLRLQPDAPFAFRAGQYLNLARGDGLARSYSIASLPGDGDGLELHVRVVPGGRMSSWLADVAEPGTELFARGPAGDCFYLPERPDEDLILAGTGTGLAPLLGIARDAVHHGHRGSIRIFHGGIDAESLYAADALAALRADGARVEVVRSALRGQPVDGIEIGALDDLVFARCGSLAGRRIYLCGNPDFVTRMRKAAFLRGAALRSIHSDAFLMSK